MKSFLKSGFAATALVCLFVSCSSDSPLESQSNNYDIDLSLSLQTDWVFANEILVELNQHRATQDLNPITKNEGYASAYATEHTKYMIEQNRPSHDNFSYRSAALTERGAVQVAETVAFGYTNAEDVVSAWINSPSHRPILEGNYNKVGFGVLKNQSGNYFFTVLFYKIE